MHTKKIPVFTKKQLDVARRTNMLAFMLEKGEIFEQVSSKFVEHVDHDSMRAIGIQKGLARIIMPSSFAWLIIMTPTKTLFSSC